MSSFKKLSKADVTTVPYAANKRWSFFYDSWPPNPSDINYYEGQNISFNINGAKTYDSTQYQSLVYSGINHLFYQSYTSSLNTGSIMLNIDTYNSASSQRPTASYFNYNINPLLIKQFPSSSGDNIDILSVSQDIYGSKILPTTFQISSSNTLTSTGYPVLIKDDGNGNLYDIAQAQSQYIDLNWITLQYFDSGSLVGTGVNFVGNIFYAHGIAVITNPSYSISTLNEGASCLPYELSNTSTSDFRTTYQYTDCNTGEIKQIIVRVSDPGRRKYICSSTIPIKLAGSGSISQNGKPCTILDVYWTISFQNEHIIHENEVRCIIKESEYNLSYNPSLVTGSYASGSLYGFATSASFHPYTTTIGLYNDENELLMVAKLAKPIMISPDTDMTFIVKYDT